MKHHYWEMPIVIYLFLGGLGGGIMFLSAIFDFFIAPGAGVLFAWPMFIALAALAVGCFFLVFELGQPLVFWRVWTTATAIIKWGATLLVIAMVFGALWWASYLPWEWISGLAGVLAGGRGAFLAIAGFAGFGIMVYTGVMLSTLKAHAFWATPALPVLFTISATSTACAAIALGLGGWPVEFSLEAAVVAEIIREIIHVVDIVLVCAEIVVLLISLDVFISITSGPINELISVLGLFHYEKYLNAVGAAMNLISSIIFVQFIGVPGVLLGTVISQLFFWISKCILVFRKYFKDGMMEYWGKVLAYTAVDIVQVLGLLWLCGRLFPTPSVGGFIGAAALCVAVPFVEQKNFSSHTS